MVGSLAAMPPSTRSGAVASASRAVGGHGLQQVAGLVADRFQRGAGDLGVAGLAGEAEDGAARLRVPIGRAEADEGRHDVDLRVRVGERGQLVHLGRLAR